LPEGLPVTGNTERTEPENRAFYPALDGLRAVAFLMVFGYHYIALPWGWAGVNVFFVLSGFLITGILYDTRNHPNRIRNFYIRRTLRIFPLYYGIFLALVLMYPFARWQWSWGWLVWPVYLGNFMNAARSFVDGSPFQRLADFQLFAGHTAWYAPLYMGHFWTLCVEEQFYLMWPGIVFWVRDRRKLMWICAAAMPICLIGRILARHWLPVWMLHQDVLSHATLFRVDDLLLGGLVALLLRGPMAKDILRWVRLAAPIAFSALLLYLACTPARHLRVHPYPYPHWTLSWGFSIISISTGLVILLAIQPGSFLFRVLSLRPLRWMGRISYGAYIFHDIFHAVLTAAVLRLCAFLSLHHSPLSHALYVQSGRIVVLLAFIVTFALAWLSFRFYESPFLNLKERWTIR
jgi:peptidoglycan/LPS O-acetylase OafA/YrhL